MRVILLLLGACVLSGGSLCGQEKPGTKPVQIGPEAYLLLPEPKALRTANSLVLGGARHTVFTPARIAPGKTKVETYAPAEFAKLGISPDSFAKRARAAADRLLTVLQPELVKDEAGRVRYAVYRGEQPISACLLAAPSLAKVFEKIFGNEIWVAAPDRHALYVFPPNPLIVDDFAADLAARFEQDAFAASEEVFVLRADSGELQAAGVFTGR